MFRHERSLVQRYATAPFSLVGVSADESVGKLREVDALELAEALLWSGMRPRDGSAK